MREHPKGTTILVLGILSLLICGPILGPIAWIMGNKARAEMNAEPGVYWSNSGSVNAGRICGMIATIVSVVLIVLFAVLAAGSN